jgi:hypothetical protein
MLRVGGLAIGGLTLADVLRSQGRCGAKSKPQVRDHGLAPGRAESIDMVDDRSPPEIRGEFRPTATNVPGIQICDLMPRQAS